MVKSQWRSLATTTLLGMSQWLAMGVEVLDYQEVNRYGTVMTADTTCITL